MIDETMDPGDAGLLELTRRLEAYADARLSPSVVRTLGMRAGLMSAAHRRAALLAAESARAAVPLPVEARRPERARPFPWRWSRPAAAFMTATLALGLVAGTAYGAKAGGPLYAVRLWVEEVNLPAGLLARAQAEAARLDARIAEAQHASIDGDAPAAEAALAAYSVIVVEAAQGTAGDATAMGAIETSVSRHTLVLGQLAGTVPAHARAAVLTALASSSKVISELDDTSTPADGRHPIGTGSSGGALPVDPTPSDPPKQSTGPKPEASDEVIGTSTDPEPTAKTPTGRDDAPTPGQPRGGGPSNTSKPAKPSKAPEAPSSGPSSRAAPGGPSAP